MADSERPPDDEAPPPEETPQEPENEMVGREAAEPPDSPRHTRREEALEEHPEPDADAQTAAPPFPVVAIGASAGGLDALKAFFAAAPADTGMAFIVATHLREDQPSMMPELIGNESELPVVQAEEGQALEPDHVYVIGPGGAIGVVNGEIRSIGRGDDAGGKLVIDLLFRSVARECGESAIAIVLSGTGTDGTIGIRTIKEKGGIAIAQEPQSASFAGMPASAIATGLVDYILVPSDMPERLRGYLSGLETRRRAQADGRSFLPDDALRDVLRQLRRENGHDFTSYKLTTVRRRVERRMNVHNITDAGDYLELLKNNKREAQQLFRELLISVTGFFRDPEAFEVLGRAVDHLVETRNDNHILRAWTPGCATGEETYSIAILLNEHAQRAEKALDVQVFGTDINPGAVESARRGIYAEGIAADMSPERLREWFVQEDHSYRVRKELRDTIVFAPQDVIKDPPFSNLDLIACRNVLIYMNTELQRDLLPVFHYALRSGGLLFLGSSESIGESNRLFEVVDAKRKVFRKKDAELARRPVLPPTLSSRKEEPEPPRVSAVAPHRKPRPVEKQIEDYLLKRFAPTSVVVTRDGDIVYIQGRTGAFLEPVEGEPRNNVFEMAREGLDAVLTPALRQAGSEAGEVTYDRVRVRANGGWNWVRLGASRMEGSEAVRGLILLTLETLGVAGAEGEGPPSAPPPSQRPERAEELEWELAHTKESLQATIEELETTAEELQSSNEELQSANEELQSSNEELETSKEELQSLNEELNTVNAELNSKIQELSQANDDLHNLLNSTQVAMVFLDTKLQVKRYTDRARGFIRLIQSDIGRPLSDLVTNLRYDNLIADCQEVLDTLIPKETEVETCDGSWQLMRVMPYRTTENVIDGVVITLFEISRIKAAEEAREDAVSDRGFFESVVETVRHPLLVLDDQYRVILANRSFERTFNTEEGDVRGRTVFALADGQWNLPELKRLLTAVLPGNDVFTDHRVEGEFPGMGKRAYLLNGRKLRRHDNEPGMILLAFEETSVESP